MPTNNKKKKKKVTKKKPANPQKSAPSPPSANQEENAGQPPAATTTTATVSSENTIDLVEIPMVSPTTTTVPSSGTIACWHGCDFLAGRSLPSEDHSGPMDDFDLAIYFVNKFTESFSECDNSPLFGFRAFKQELFPMLMRISLEQIELSQPEERERPSTKLSSERLKRIFDRIRTMLLFCGTHTILLKEDQHHADGSDPLIAERFCAQAVAYLEKTYLYEEDCHLDAKKKKKMEKEHWALVLDSFDRGERIVTGFFAKRIPCSCLNDKYAACKAQPKMGLCFHCREKKLRSDLMLCGGCNIVHYCSRDCQRANWKKNHKALCPNLWDGLYKRTYDPQLPEFKQR
eukprot:scaffold865_cov87-Cylindrotheca_fusiformis.AAC.7